MTPGCCRAHHRRIEPPLCMQRALATALVVRRPANYHGRRRPDGDNKVVAGLMGGEERARGRSLGRRGEANGDYTHLCGYWMVDVDVGRVVRVERGGLYSAAVRPGLWAELEWTASGREMRGGRPGRENINDNLRVLEERLDRC